MTKENDYIIDTKEPEQHRQNEINYLMYYIIVQNVHQL